MNELIWSSARRSPRTSTPSMKIRTRTTLSGFGLMLLADAARVFGLREDQAFDEWALRAPLVSEAP